MAVHTTTLGAVRTAIRRRVDMVNDQRVTDTEFNEWIVGSLAELHGLLVTADSEYLVNRTTLTLTGAESYSLPTDFYKSKLVESSFGNGRYKRIERLKMDERDKLTDPFVWYPQLPMAGYPAGYDIVGPSIYFFPEAATGTVRIWYYPCAPQPSADGDSFDIVNGFDEYIVADVALKVATKLGADVAPWLSIKGRLERRVQETGQERDMGGSWGVTILPRGR